MANIAETEPNDSKSSANTVNLGDTVTGIISSTSDPRDYFQVTVGANSILQLDLSSAIPQSDYFGLFIYDALSKLVGSNIVGHGYGATTGVGITVAGIYYVEVYALTGAITSYDLKFSSPAGTASGYETRLNTTFATADQLSLDHVVKGQLAVANDDDYYKITTTSTGVLSLDFTAPSSRNYASFTLSIYDANHNLLQERNSGHSETFVMNAAGTYYFQIHGGIDSGNYSVNAHVTSLTDSSIKTLSSGGGISGALVAGGHDLVQVYLTAGTTYEFKATGATLADPSLVLLDANLKTVGVNDDLPIYTTEPDIDPNPQIGYTAATTGTYYLQVGGNGGAGFYALTEKIDTVSQLIPPLLQLQSSPNYRWNAGASIGTAVTLTYSFMTQTSHGEIGFAVMSVAQQQAVRNVLAQYSKIANITFVETLSSAGAQIQFGIADLTSGAGTTFAIFNADGSIRQKDVFVDVSNATFTEGSYSLETLIHETGHALALKHPGNYNGSSGVGVAPFSPAVFDNTKFEIMSYNDNLDSSISHSTPGILDIAALQYLYGANVSGRGTTHTFTFSNSVAFVSSLLSNGSVDTIDASNQTLGSTINLVPGTFSSIGVSAHDNVAIPFGATVIAAIGGSGNDVINGNTLDNQLTGGGGNDTLDGGGGNDTARYAGVRTAFTIEKTASGFTVTNKIGAEGIDTLTSIETLVFGDGSLAIDYSDVVQELYIAFFGRPADSGGLVNFEAQLRAFGAPTDIQKLDAAYNTNATIRSLIDSFGSSAESNALYNGGTAAFVTAIYQNVLNRAPDAGGLAYWSSAIDSGVLSRPHASLSIMAGASANTSTQGLIDGVLVTNKIMLGSDFTFAIDTPSEINAYSGNAAAASARAMLAALTGTSSSSTFGSIVNTTLSALIAHSATSSIASSTTVEQFPEGAMSAISDTTVPLIGIMTLMSTV